MQIRWVTALWVVLLALSASSAAARDDTGPAPDSEPFVELPGLEGNVDFWTLVFSEWTTGQVVIHDLDYPAIIFEVIELPEPIEATYTDEQTDFVTAIRESWEDYLEQLEHKVATRSPLSDIEKQWAAHFATTVGTDSLQGAHARVRSQRGLRERFREGLERSFRFDRIIREILIEYGLPEDLAYLPHVESSFQYHARSSAGAAGIWQFTRGTGKRYLNINSAIDERLDPIAATRGAAAYLRDAYEKLETWPLAVTSYNHGVQGMLRAKARFGSDFERIYEEYDGRLFGFASKNFYAEFLAARRIASDPDRYFPEGYTPEPEHDLESVKLEKRVTTAWIASRYAVPLEELALLNPGWSTRSVKSGMRRPSGTEVWLPRGTLESVVEEPASPSSGAAGSGSYTVRKGDTLSGIAQTHGTTIDRLRELNGLSARSNLIRAGQELVVDSAPASTTHVVSRGETLIRIASSYGVRLVDLLSVNTLTMSSIIRPGQVLHIPH